ncbi:hypothetical protein MKW94_016895 [Papaver nudicaule]|uniref:ATP-dependent DNA ligase family profile domain-containing protein n=1 Tax=Papaver nudicaule TaxID=74823 RepID=A0AA42B3Q5_PAPNU|nr:hypothetical protein [Papaver nudicaule]
MLSLFRLNTKKIPKSSSPCKKDRKTHTEDTLNAPHAKKSKTLTVEVDMDEKIALLKKKGLEFKPKSAAFWKPGESIPTVIATTPGDLVSFIYLCAGKIYPAHDGIELGMGDVVIIKSLSEAYGKSVVQLRNELQTVGDLRSSQSTVSEPAPLTAGKVLDAFCTIAKDSGMHSQERKMKNVKALLVAARDCEFANLSAWRLPRFSSYIGAYYGRGKRTGGFGGFLLACTRFSEQMLEELSSSLQTQLIFSNKPYYRFTDATNPDVWFEPTEVWEVKAVDLSISPVYLAAAGVVDAIKGISLRFPRLLRVRKDKKPEDATTSGQVTR